MGRQAKNGSSKSEDRAQASKPTADELLAIEELVADLEKRLRRVNEAVKREASGATTDVSDFVNDTFNDVSERLRDSVRTLAHSVGEEAVRAGADTLNRIAREVDHRPFALLAAAAGIGFLLGLATRRL